MHVHTFVFSKKRRKTSQPWCFVFNFISMQTECVTVTSYVLDQKKRYPGSSGELTILLNALLTAIKACAAAVRKAGIANLYVQ